jgi:hypothetical protein
MKYLYALVGPFLEVGMSILSGVIFYSLMYLFICLGSPAVASDLVPPDDGDIASIRKAFIGVNYGPDYCDGIAMKPYNDVAILYLSTMNKWLALAISAQLAHLKSLEEQQQLTRERSDLAQLLVAIQNVLLQGADLLSSFSSVTGVLQDLQKAIAPSDALKTLMQKHPDRFEVSLTEKISSAKEALSESVEAAKNFQSALQTQPLVPSDPSIFTLRGRELDARISDELPGAVNSIGDLESALTKIEDQISALKDTAALIKTENFADVSKSIIAIGTAIARFRQGTLLEEIRELNTLTDAVDPPWTASFKDYQRLHTREVAAETLIKDLQGHYPTQPCDMPCPTSNQKPFVGLAFGGQPYPGNAGMTYGVALPTFGVETSGKYAKAVSEETNTLAQRRKNVDKSTIRLTDGKSIYKLGEEVSYAIHKGGECYAPRLRVAISSIVLSLGTKTPEAGPFHADATGTLKVDHVGKWRGSLYAEVENQYFETMQRFTFEVVSKCLGLLPKGIGPTDRMATDGHLSVKSFDFTLNEKGKYGFVRGRLKVTPGISCIDNVLTIPVFAGVSQEHDYFNVDVTDGDGSYVGYLEQWLKEERVTFDNGQILKMSGNDFINGRTIPDGVKRVTRIEMDFDGGGDEANATLTWTPE